MRGYAVEKRLIARIGVFVAACTQADCAVRLGIVSVDMGRIKTA